MGREVHATAGSLVTPNTFLIVYSLLLQLASEGMTWEMSYLATWVSVGGVLCLINRML